MKRIFNIALSAVLLVLASCANNRTTDAGAGNSASSDKGTVTINVNSRAMTESSINYILRIYQKGAEKDILVRRYTSSEEIPTYIWLLEGNYKATIEGGSTSAASFESNYYYGETDFAIKGGETTQVDLVGVLQNIPVEVVFDQTVTDGFKPGYKVDVAAIEDLASVTKETPKLTYNESKVGYFIMPEGVTTISWQFTGTYVYADGEEVEVNKSGKIENVEIKKHYTLSFKYSKDAPGFLGGLDVSVDTTLDERDDHIAFNPDPEVKGVGFDLAEPYNYTGGDRQYLAVSPADFMSVTLVAGGNTYDPVNSTVAGVTLTGLETPELYITLSDAFFNMLSGGDQTVELTLTDRDGGSVTKKLPYVLQGVNAYKKSGTNLWTGTSLLTATVFGAPSSVTISYREGEGEWKTYTAAASATENTYEVTVDGIGAGYTYEYALAIDGTTVGTSRTFTTAAGAQIPNGDLEGWCTSSSGVVIPFATEASSYWCTGNWGTIMLSTNITNSSTDVRPGTTGTKSAYLNSENLTMKFAAGNIYVGSWGGMSGTNAVVYFGQPFDYNAKPKAIRFWAKFNCGTIDVDPSGVTPSSDKDISKIFCCMATDRHAVDSSQPDATTFSPSDEAIKSGDARYGIVLYSAYMETSTSQTEWKQFELPFTFYGSDANQVPTHIILTFTCSGYGDYFGGSSESWMYVDDIELVY